MRSPRAAPHGEVGARGGLPRGGGDPGQLPRVQRGLRGRVARVRGSGGAVRSPAVARQPQQRPAHRQRRPADQRGLQTPAAAQQIRRPGLEHAGVELGGVEQPVRVGDPVGLLQRGVHVGDARRREDLAHVPVREPLQAAQGVGGAGRPGQLGQPLLQRELVGAARTREQLQPPHPRKRRGQPRPAPQRRTQHLEAEQRVPGVAVVAGPLGGDRRRGRAAPGQCPLDQGVRGEHPPAPAPAGRQHQVGEPDEPGIVLDERGLGLLDAHDRTGRGGGGGGRDDIL
ncbi:hypothetical protein RKD28_005229 [Streptomyces sp. SAI-229]